MRMEYNAIYEIDHNKMCIHLKMVKHGIHKYKYMCTIYMKQNEKLCCSTDEFVFLFHTFLMQGLALDKRVHPNIIFGRKQML